MPIKNPKQVPKNINAGKVCLRFITKGLCSPGNLPFLSGFSE